MTKVAIIGAGITGLTFANKLLDQTTNTEIVFFEKSRGVSGRTSTRRAEPYSFDHGAPFFSAKSDEFKTFLQPLITANVVSNWQANIVEVENNEKKSSQWQADNFFVGVPKMNAIAKHLAQDLNIRLGTRVEGIEKLTEQNQWCLTSDTGEDLGIFDWVVCTAPAQQAAELVPSNIPFYQTIINKKMQGCYALMLGFEEALNLDFDVALFKGTSSSNNTLFTDTALSCITVNSQKPQRPDANKAYGLTILSSNKWAEEHIDDDQEWVKAKLLAEASDFTGNDLTKANHIGMHRWRYANTDNAIDSSLLPESGYLCDADNQFAVAGDWLIRGSVENAYFSGNGLANEMIEILERS